VSERDVFDILKKVLGAEILLDKVLGFPIMKRMISEA